MKRFILYLASVVLCICAASVSAVPQPDEKALIEAECDVPPAVAYCLDMMHLGSNYNSDGSQESAELQHDVDEVPIGMCAWGDWVGKLSADECMQVLAEYEDEDDEDDDVPETGNEAETEVHTTRIFKKIKRGLKKIGKKISKGAKKVAKGVNRAGKKIAKGVKRTVRKVTKFCKRNPKVCKKVAEYGIKIIRGKGNRNSRTTRYPQY
ncbi:hypothetical protein BWQ96_08555 [Gracilariopsis chorda]|uniref:Uncharacterized protein n=1 Tax=Gracilariopsis chorda TaxID=448386 RepID=A0A2V3IHZ1_9FLOR|nr:hypothetical protein BWQ96_08555 [Gracilariopsis chorda]|eukprot:PXF41725.1 hypothetical protein BWQ96_08555 [Gracilariopsis chorda]